MGLFDWFKKKDECSCGSCGAKPMPAKKKAKKKKR
jgi:hypothetical protein